MVKAARVWQYHLIANNYLLGVFRVAEWVPREANCNPGYLCEKGPTIRWPRNDEKKNYYCAQLVVRNTNHQIMHTLGYVNNQIMIIARLILVLVHFATRQRFVFRIITKW